MPEIKGLTEEQRILLDWAAFRLTVTDPRGVHQRCLDALALGTEALLTAVPIADKESVDVENSYRVRLGLEPKPYPWEDIGDA
jgi:hypothetical protein